MFGATIGISRLHFRTTTSYESFGIAKKLKDYALQWRNGLCKIETRTYCNWKAFAPNQWSNTKCTSGQVIGCQKILSTRPSIFQYFRNTATNKLSLNTKVSNNVMLYRYEKPYMYKFATVFAAMALIGCLTMADLVYRVLCKNLWNKDKDLKTRLQEHLIPIAAILTGVIGGPIITGVIIFVILRSIKYIILRKGGQDVTLVTYHPFKKEVVNTVSLDKVSSLTTRDGMKAYIPIKIKGRKWNYLLDKNGHFVNPELFDDTVGIKRFE